MLGFVEELVDFKRSEKGEEAENMVLIEEGCLKLRRRIGKAVDKRGGNAVIGYRQVVDNEGNQSKRIVVRGYGTAAYLVYQGDDIESYLGFSASHQFKKGGISVGGPQ